MKNLPISISMIERRICMIRGQKVMLDSDLAELYQVETRILNRAVKRNIERFPSDFMFQLTPNEFLNLRSQTVTSKVGRGGRRYLPFVFTEHGVAMLSSVLRSPRAIEVTGNPQINEPAGAAYGRRSKTQNRFWYIMQVNGYTKAKIIYRKSRRPLLGAFAFG